MELVLHTNNITDLTNEISLIANMGYEKKFSDKSKILFSLDAKNTNRYTKSRWCKYLF